MSADRVPDFIWRDVNQQKGLKRHLLGVGERVARAALAESRKHGGEANYSVRYSVRPRGRAQVQVFSDNRAEEYGGEDTPRIGALRRVIKRGGY